MGNKKSKTNDDALIPENEAGWNDEGIKFLGEEPSKDDKIIDDKDNKKDDGKDKEDKPKKKHREDYMVQTLKTKPLKGMYNKKCDILNPRTVFFGPSGCGKTTLVETFVEGKETHSEEETIEDMFDKEIVVNDKGIFYRILDTGGSDEYEQYHNVWSKNVDFICLIYDASKENGIKELDSWYEFVSQIKVNEKQGEVVPPIYVYGTKCDKGQVVTQEQVDKWEEMKQIIKHFFVNIKDIETIDAALIEPIKDLHENMQEIESK